MDLIILLLLLLLLLILLVPFLLSSSLLCVRIIAVRAADHLTVKNGRPTSDFGGMQTRDTTQKLLKIGAIPGEKKESESPV